MRSGQYKVCGAGGPRGGDEVTLGHFRSSAGDGDDGQGFPHLNSLVLTKTKLSEARPINRSCENLTSEGRGGGQRVRGLPCPRGEVRPVEEGWQYGQVVTLPRRPRLSLALSQSALHHLPSDAASSLSASSGYSSSASSSYGSFKSNRSASCSTLPRLRGRAGSSSPTPARNSSTLVDNPMYDLTPAHARAYARGSKSPGRDEEHIYDLTPDDPARKAGQDEDEDDPLYATIPGHAHHDCLDDLAEHPLAARLLLTPDSGTHGGLDSLEESALDSLEAVTSLKGGGEEDQVARQCREYFQRRLRNSESLKKRWSMCSTDSGADSGDSDALQHPPQPPDPSAAAVPPPPAPEDPVCTASGAAKAPSKTQLDHKMEFLRKEIASLMSQDNALFRQLLTLHESISALKTNPPHPLRPPSPTSLDSFTEEEEEEEDDDDDDDEEEEEEEEKEDGVDGKLTRMMTEKEDDEAEDEDEGLEVDHSASPTSTLSSKSSTWDPSSPPAPQDDDHVTFSSCSSSNRVSRRARALRDLYSTGLDLHSRTTFNQFSNSSSNGEPRCSITTGNDFNVSIAINAERSAGRRSSSTSRLAKNSHVSSTSISNHADTNLDQTFGGSLGSVYHPPEGRSLVRTRVSIPPSARNRDRNARPESLRLSSDMASHTRVLLKARSFAEASLRASSSRRMREGKSIVRTSLREEHRSLLDVSCMTQDDVTQSKSISNDVELLHNRCASATDLPNDHHYTGDLVPYSTNILIPDSGDDCQENCISLEVHSETVHTTNITIFSTSGMQAQEDLVWQEDAAPINASSSRPFCDFPDCTSPPYMTPDSSPYTTPSSSLDSPSSPLRKILMLPVVQPDHLDIHQPKCHKLRTRSFTGLTTPYVDSPRETLDDHKTSLVGSKSFKFPDGQAESRQRGTTANRRARLGPSGRPIRFLSDLGLGARSKSEREVFV